MRVASFAESVELTRPDLVKLGLGESTSPLVSGLTKLFSTPARPHLVLPAKAYVCTSSMTGLRPDEPSRPDFIGFM